MNESSNDRRRGSQRVAARPINDTETHVSLVRTMLDLTGCSLSRLLDQYADLSYDYNCESLSASGRDRAESIETARDMAAIANEIERRTLDRETHVCHLGGVGIKELYLLASRLHIELAAFIATVAVAADAKVEL